MEGSREDIPLMAQNLGNQLANLMQPAADMASGNDKDDSPSLPLTIDHSASERGKQKRRRRPMGGSQPVTNADAPAIEWQHDPAKYGSPQQSWTTAKKAIWILYVASQAASVGQLTAPQIADTFNRKFKQAGTVRATNVSRDLGGAKMKIPALTGEDTAKAIAEWYLTEAGINFALALINDVSSTNAAA